MGNKKENDFEHVVDETINDVGNALSKSKQKRLERKKNLSKQKRLSAATRITGIVISSLLCAVVVVLIAMSIVKSVNEVRPDGDFSANLTDNGMIEGVKASDMISLCDYKNIVVPVSEVTYTDEEFKTVIDEALSAHKVLTEEGEVKDQDTVNIDYVGTMDGVEFEGGNSQGNGYDLTIGSGSFIDDFEQQLIGYKPGETAVVNVTFPEDYQEASLAGKDAQFTVEIHGIYQKPEYDDDFICAYYSDHGSTVAEYEKYVKDSYYDTQLRAYIENYLAENSTVVKYPKTFLKGVKANTKYEDIESYNYMNEMYTQYYGEGYSTFEEYIGMSDEEYEEDIKTRAEETVKTDLIYQAVIENEGIEITDADYSIVEDMYGTEEYLDNALESYGRGYLMLSAVREKAIEAVKGYVTVK